MSDNFLIKLGFTEKILNDIIEKHSKAMYESILLNEYECIKIFAYLKNKNIRCIDTLIVNYPELFLNTYEEISDMFINLTSDDVKIINDDYTYIRKFFYNEP